MAIAVNKFVTSRQHGQIRVRVREWAPGHEYAKGPTSSLTQEQTLPLCSHASLCGFMSL